MSIKFKSSEKLNPLKPTVAPKYYAKAISDGEVSTEELLQLISSKSNISYLDCLRFMLFLEETVSEQLSNGKIVRLGDIGNFQVGISSNGEATAGKVNRYSIKAAKVNFRAGKSFRKLLNLLEYQKVTK